MNDRELYSFIKQKENEYGEHTTAKEKWIKLNHLIKDFHVARDSVIIDIGGEKTTGSIVKQWFSEADLYTVNIIDREDYKISKFIKVDLEKEDISDHIKKTAKIIFFMDVIEHLCDPDKVLNNILKVLDDDGYLIISTPNLADIFNRIFLLMGYSLHNYNVSQWYKTGNPFIMDLSGKRHGNHKSVFTMKQLKELLEKIYKLKLIATNGYSYYECDWLDYYDKDTVKEIKAKSNIMGHNFLRRTIASIMPKSCSEGMLLIAQKQQKNK